MTTKTWYNLWIILGIIYLNINNSCKKEDNKAPMVITTAVSQADSVVVIGGNIIDQGGSAVSEKGVVWSINQNPTLESNNGFTSDGPGTGPFSNDLSNLAPDTRYYVRAYATNAEGTGYGQPVNFKTSPSNPSSMLTISIAQIVQGLSYSTVYYSVRSNGGFIVEVVGIVWSTNQNPSLVSNNGIISYSNVSGDYSSKILNLAPGTKYFVRAYAGNYQGEIAYSEQRDFTTPASSDAMPTVSITSISPFSSSANVSYSVTGNGGFAVTAMGVVWSTNQNPSLESNNGFTSDGPGTGDFSTVLSNLMPDTTYYVIAYATNSKGETSYSAQNVFKTYKLSTFITTPPTDITSTSASSGGEFTGSWPLIIARGVCWSTSPNPTTADSRTNNSNGTGNYVSSITGLVTHTTYYIRAWAYWTKVYHGNSRTVVVYGNQVSFTTN
jgi:hypothetical protein